MLSVMGFLLFLIVGVMSALVWNGLKQGQFASTCITRAAGAGLGLAAAGVAAGSWWSGRSWIEVWQQVFQANLQVSLDLYRKWNWSEEELQRAAHWATMLFSDALIGWLVVAVIGMACFGYLFLRRLAPHLEGSRLPLRFSEWSAPAGFVWPLLAALGLIALGQRWPGWPTWLGLNALVVLAMFYLAAGWAIILHHLQRRGLPRRSQVLLTLVLAVFPSLLSLVAIIGVLNTWLDLRQFAREKVETEE